MRFRQLLGGMTAVGAMVALAIPGVATAHGRAAGFVYTETNAAGGNAVRRRPRVAGRRDPGG